MTAEKALEASILHWEENLKHAESGTLYEYQINGDNCPLCDMFDERGIGECAGCPVYEHTGLDTCSGTPWERVADAMADRCEAAIIVTAVQDELDFLKSLRKSDESE